MKRNLLALAALLAFAGGALADTLTLKDGTKLEGVVVEQKGDEVVFEHSVGGAKTKSTFKRSDVKALEFAASTEAKPEKPPEKKPEPVPEYGETKDYKHGVIIVLDRSGSMAISNRFNTALDEVDKILLGLPATTGFGVYLFDTKVVSVFDSNAVKTKDPMRGRMRKRIAELGGLNRSGYTDIGAALAPAIRARPDAIYLLSDGVPTKGDLQSDALLKAIKDLMPTKKFPIHVTAIRGGEHVEGLEENDTIARAILKRIAEGSSGKYREVESKDKETTALKKKAGADDEVDFHCYHRNREFIQRELRHPGFEVEVRDSLFSEGKAVIEYASVSLELRTRTDAGVLFDEHKDLPLDFRGMDADKKTTFGLGGTLDAGPKSFWSHPIRVVRPQDDREGDDGAKTFVKIPTDGGTLEVVYRRGTKEWKRTFIIKVPLRDTVAK